VKTKILRTLSIGAVVATIVGIGIYLATPPAIKPNESTDYYVSYQFRIDYDDKTGTGFGACQLSQHDGKKLDNIDAISDAINLIRNMFLPEEYRKNTNAQVVLTYIHELKKREE